MELRKGKLTGIWFLWPSVIYYAQLGVEIRYLKWYVGMDWGKYHVHILTEESEAGNE